MSQKMLKSLLETLNRIFFNWYHFVDLYFVKGLIFYLESWSTMLLESLTSCKSIPLIWTYFCLLNSQCNFLTYFLKSNEGREGHSWLETILLRMSFRPDPFQLKKFTLYRKQTRSILLSQSVKVASPRGNIETWRSIICPV